MRLLTDPPEPDQAHMPKVCPDQTFTQAADVGFPAARNTPSPCDVGQSKNGSLLACLLSNVNDRQEPA
jgi:hypothetical protein